ncbi:hypothetical protein M878_04785 [Streptomyces roseochromogenus subsp. oscitans DS 12.976]|uniref:Uncharacterized protein n=2 Tax=Streptomyces roseochromogenus TaxID=285450 RepID=V6KUM3_STRRC|nr:hypothetical protein M878_04785 [Streptomyces roseochromogenus subsp. oscitans DS 12.976]
MEALHVSKPARGLEAAGLLEHTRDPDDPFGTTDHETEQS